MPDVVWTRLRALRFNVRQVNGNGRGKKCVIYDSICTRGVGKILKATELNKRGNFVVDAVIRMLFDDNPKRTVMLVLGIRWQTLHVILNQRKFLQKKLN